MLSLSLFLSADCLLHIFALCESSAVALLTFLVALLTFLVALLTMGFDVVRATPSELDVLDALTVMLIV